MSLEKHFDPIFTTRLALREKQIQQNYRPLIGIHKWFARRPGTVLRNLLLSEFNGADPLGSSFWRSHKLRGVIADPFMGGGTTIYEANRLGFSVVGADINPMAYWIVRQSIGELDLDAFAQTAELVAAAVEKRLTDLGVTECTRCGDVVPVKYWLWVKTQRCPACATNNDLFPGYLLAEAVRHPKHVLVCHSCGALNEFGSQPTRDDPGRCDACGTSVHVEGSATRQKINCKNCRTSYAYPEVSASTPPEHRMWAIEYHCGRCKPKHKGRFFKRPDVKDIARYAAARELQEAEAPSLPIPNDPIPAGDETDRLRRWGYRFYREMFNARQILGLGLLLQQIRAVGDRSIQRALLTVFSDFLRYQNMLCRYDTYALKCQDIFSVHGFPVGLVQCENALLGVPRVGSGSFRHFVEKYLRAKRYCIEPFETRQTSSGKEIVPISGERIQAELVDSFPSKDTGEAWLRAAPATTMDLPAGSLDGVFTDPPYFDNVQYAELIDFCYVWLRLALSEEMPEFALHTTRNGEELTGNATRGRGLEHFTDGLSKVFSHYARALKPGRPFVFTFHHNDPDAYVPLVVAILDAGLECTEILPAAGEMAASLHIAGTGSSILDSVFVCRRGDVVATDDDVAGALRRDAAAMKAADVKISDGDLRCLAAGRLARNSVNRLSARWNIDAPLDERMARAREVLRLERARVDLDELIADLLQSKRRVPPKGEALAASV